MTIHIPIKGAFVEKPTGVESYIRKLLEVWSKKEFKKLNFVLYYRGEPDNDVLWQGLQGNDSFILKKVSLPYLWTQLGMSYELVRSRYTNSTNDTNNTNRTNFHESGDENTNSKGRERQDRDSSSAKFRDQVSENSVLFVPAHVLPLYCGMPAVVTIHGLEFEHYPDHYPLWHRLYLKLMTRLSCIRAEKIIAVSEVTKEDLMRFYDVLEDKIEVIHHGVETPKERGMKNTELTRNRKDTEQTRNRTNTKVKDSSDTRRYPQINVGGNLRPSVLFEYNLLGYDYILYLGRVETKKNILNMIEAFEMLKRNQESGIKNQDLKFVLAGGRGYGYGGIQLKIKNGKLENEVIELGYVLEEEKWRLLENADVFCYATLYEGFGIPILEAQKVGTPTVVGAQGAAPDVGSDGVLKANPEEPKEIARTMSQLLEDDNLREELVEKGYANVERFSWQKCAKETLEYITGIC